LLPPKEKKRRTKKGEKRRRFICRPTRGDVRPIAMGVEKKKKETDHAMQVHRPRGQRGEREEKKKSAICQNQRKKKAPTRKRRGAFTKAEVQKKGGFQPPL